MGERAVLVVGGAGYVGSNCAKALAKAGYTPVVFDNFAAGHRHNVKWGPMAEGDIRDAAAVEAACREHRPIAAMHFAANIEVGIGEREPAAFYDNNVAGTLSLLKGLTAGGVDTLIFSSTCATYGPPQRLPLDETHPQEPASVYGRTKLMVEQILADFTRAYGLKHAALRYFNAAGADREGDHGEEHDPETHLIPNALKAAAGGEGGLKIFGSDYDTPDGTCLRDYIHVEDLGVGHVLAVEALMNGADSFALNLGTGEGISVLEVIQAIGRVVGTPPPHEFADRRPGDVPALYADTTRAREFLKFRPTASDIDTIVSSAWAFHQRAWGLAEAS